MTDSTFNYDECKPWRDGKLRAVDSNKDTHVVLCNDATGSFPVRTYRERDGLSCSMLANGRGSSLDLVGPALEAPREWYILLKAGRLWTVAETLEEAQRTAAFSDSIKYVHVVEKRS